MKKLPTSACCFVCGRDNNLSLGLTFYQPEPGQTIAETRVAEAYQGYPGMVHGGVIAAMLDEASGRAVCDEPDQFFVTSELKVRYRKPVPTEIPITVRGYLVSQRGRIRRGRAEITDQNGVLLAESEGVFVELTLDDEMRMQQGRDEWRVEDDE